MHFTDETVVAQRSKTFVQSYTVGKCLGWDSNTGILGQEYKILVTVLY